MSNVQLTDGRPVPGDRSHTRLKANGQQEGYVVLSAEERAKGFVKPLRRSYLHSGLQAPAALRDLTADEKAKWGSDWAKYDPSYPKRGPHSLGGKFWTQEQVDRIGKGCGAITTMATSIAETYARDPRFYSGTFCCSCGAHFDLNEFTWEPDGEPMDVSLQEAWHAERTAREAAARKAREEEAERRERAELARLKAKYEPATSETEFSPRELPTR